MKYLAIVFALLCAAPAFAQHTYYIGLNGSDSNTAVQAQNKATPWAHIPGAANCTSVCASTTIHSGDNIIVRGGDTESAASWPLTAVAGVYYGVDKTWFAGGSYVKPIMTGGGTYPGSGTGSSGAMFLFTSGDTFDDWEVTGYDVNQSSTNVAIFRSSGTISVQPEIKNLYVHGWTVGSSQTFDKLGIVWDSSNLVLFDHNVVDGFDATIPACLGGSPCAAGTVLFIGSCNADHNYMASVNNVDNASCGSGGVNFHDNTAINIDIPWDNSTHGNFFQSNNAITGPCYIYNNYVNLLGLGFTFPLNLHAGSNNTCYFFNNDYNNIVSVIGISLSTLDSTITTTTVNSFNNTLEPGADAGSGPSNSCQIVEADATAITYNLTNNHCVTTGPVNSFYPSGSCTGSNCTLNLTTNLVQSKATANGQGYVTATYFSPQNGSGGTIGAGTNETSLCNAMSDATAKAACKLDTTLGVSEVSGEGGFVVSPTRTPNVRPSSGAWDSGAYQFFAVPGISAPSGLKVTPGVKLQ